MGREIAIVGKTIEGNAAVVGAFAKFISPAGSKGVGRSQGLARGTGGGVEKLSYADASVILYKAKGEVCQETQESASLQVFTT